MNEFEPFAPPTLLHEDMSLGDYQIRGFLGVGSTGEVWCAQHTQTKQYVALKILKSDQTTDRQRFLLETRILSELSHPGVIRIHDHGEWENRPWFTMDLLAPLPPVTSAHQATHLALQLCDAVETLHAHGIIHRDIKRANIMMHKGHLVLMDLSIAKPMNEALAQSLMTCPNPTYIQGIHAVGSLGRSAPEQFDGSKITPATDVYAIGMFIRDIYPNWRTDPILERVLPRAISADPALRYASAHDFAKDLSASRTSSLWRKVALIAAPLLIGVAIAAYFPLKAYWQVHDWQFARSSFITKERTQLQPYTVYTHIVIDNPVTEIALPDNPHGVVWSGAFVFNPQVSPQRLIIHSPSASHKQLIGHVYNGGNNREIILVGDIDWHCTDIHGFVHFPTQFDGHRLGEPFSESWVSHTIPTSDVAPAHIRRAPTLQAARALAPLDKAEPIQ